MLAGVKENLESLQQWGLTSAESSGSSIMQFPQWPLLKSSVASQDPRRKKAKPHSRHRSGGSLLKNTFNAAKLHFLSAPVIWARQDSIYNLGHALNADERCCLICCGKCRISVFLHKPECQWRNALAMSKLNYRQTDRFRLSVLSIGLCGENVGRQSIRLGWVCWVKD